MANEVAHLKYLKKFHLKNLPLQPQIKILLVSAG